MTDTITLHPLPRDRVALVAGIQVTPAQEKFSGNIAEAIADAPETQDFHMIALDGHPVGFFKIDRGFDAQHHFARPGEPGLRAFMIDRDSQGRGIATAAVRALNTYLPAQYPGLRSVCLMVEMSNRRAVRCYRGAGFVDTGEIFEDGPAGAQLVMRMVFAAPERPQTEA